MVSETIERANAALPERCARLERELQEYRRLRAMADQARTFVARRQNLAEATAGLAPLMETLAFFRRGEIATELPTALAARLRGILTKLRASYLESPDSLGDLGEFKGLFSRELPTLTQKLQEN